MIESGPKINTLKAEFEECRKGKLCDRAECEKLRDYWGYSGSYPFTVKEDGQGFIFTITADKPKIYGW